MLDAVDTHLSIYDVSYLWLRMIGFVLSIFFELIINFATGMNKTRKLAESLIFPCCRSFWRVQFSESYPPAFHGQLVTKEERMKFAEREAIDSKTVQPSPWNRLWYLELPVEEPQLITNDSLKVQYFSHGNYDKAVWSLPKHEWEFCVDK